MHDGTTFYIGISRLVPAAVCFVMFLNINGVRILCQEMFVSVVLVVANTIVEVTENIFC